MKNALLAACAVLLLCAVVTAASRPAPEPKVARVWHGRVPNAKAEEYAAYLAAALPKFKTIKGNLGYRMDRETEGDLTHFQVTSFWTSKEAIKAYAGEDISKTRHLSRDHEYLIEPEQTVRNYDIVLSVR